MLSEQDTHFELIEVTADDAGRLESLTLRSHEDSSAMDITFVTGEEVTEQVEELLQTLVKSTLTDRDREKLNYLGECNSRFDIFHFEEVTFGGDDSDDILDPGALLLVLEQLTHACHGVGIDPQSGSIVQ